MRIRLNFSYNGSAFSGWQIQSDVSTVQATLEQVLATVYGVDSVRVIASGRTDRGVHAIGQVVHFDEPVPRAPQVLLHALQGLLPDVIQVWRCKIETEDWHARYSAYERTYGYRILQKSDLFMNGISWSPGKNLDMNKLNECSEIFRGQHDFRQFATQPDPEENPICEVHNLTWGIRKNCLIFTISADRFLRRMVRTIVSTVVESSLGKISREEISSALQGKPTHLGAPVPPQGLALLRVRYESDDDDDIPPPSPWSLTDETFY